jgi:hypothetical protein
MMALCRMNNIRILFLYLPGYGSPQTFPSEWKTYRQYGDLLIPPRVILDNTKNWFDDNHLNKAGAGELTKWIAVKLKRYL